ncbi:DUF6883 domain-containing protein [Acidithiobacillus sp.]|uniref:DUF6883 domain-containing protein n=1 Tax=Acidithiobacillus sp. TaxID=1872118 RepID=UPI003D079731
MKLPGSEHAYIDDQKLVRYCLNHEHPEGRHKARVYVLQDALTSGTLVIWITALEYSTERWQHKPTEKPGGVHSGSTR